MKTVEISAFGIENLQLVEREKSQPSSGQVLVKIDAVSLNYLDLAVVKGFYNPNLPLPHVPTSDGAGVVEAVGTNVTEWQPGDRVMVHFIQNWIYGPAQPALVQSKVGLDKPGVLSEYVVLPASGLVRVPVHMSSEEASTLPIAGLTAWSGLVEYGHLQVGRTVLTQGTGGVSIAALQLAKAAGARVIATSSSDEKLERLKALGADEVINYNATPNWSARVKELTNGEGVDAMINVAGGESISQSLQAVSMNGTVGMVGFVDSADVNFSIYQAMVPYATMKGFQVGSRTMFERYVRALEINTIRPVIDQVFALDQVQDAYRYMESGQHFGKVVISLR